MKVCVLMSAALLLGNGAIAQCANSPGTVCSSYPPVPYYNRAVPDLSQQYRAPPPPPPRVYTPPPAIPACTFTRVGNTVYRNCY